MPVVLPDDAWARWIDPAPGDRGELLGLLGPNDDLALDVYAVNRFVNDVRQDGPALIEPLVVATRI
jgi:putative SOS response-associated peptidase YedK